MALKVATINANGLRDANKRMGFLQWLSYFAFDIVCVQETHVLSVEECNSWFSNFGYLSSASCGSNHSCGTIILFRPVFSLTCSSSDPDGRFVSCDFDFRDKRFRVVSLYAPNVNPHRDDFFAYVSSMVDLSIPSVLCGDFNAVFSRGLDRGGAVSTDSSRDSAGSLKALFQDCCVVDAWRHCHPSSSSFTWRKSDGSCSSRIDLVGVPLSWVPFVSSCEIVPCAFSDHSLVALEVSIPETIPRGPGRWKFNSSLLVDDAFVASIHSFWASWRLKKSCFPSLQKWWDVGKSKIKGLSVEFGSAKKKSSLEARSLLTNLASHLKCRLDEGLVSCQDAYDSTLASLAKLDLADAEAAKVRSRVRWAEEGETSSAYFLRLEKKHGEASWFSAIRNDRDEIVTDIGGIIDAWVSFYTDLFSACATDQTIQSNMLDCLYLSLPPSDVPVCEGLLTCDEVLLALNGMARGKSPGSDGLTVEFFLKFWDVLGSDLVEVFNSSYRDGLLPSSSCKGLITLLFKKGDRLDRKNWRPITLLNIDYKLCARTLAGRLLRVIHHVVHSDQTCGIPGRFIGENVVLLRDIVDITSELNLPAAILSLDQEKAFDRVDWNFMFLCLERMGFGQSFVRWVRLLYTRARCSILVDGYTSPVFYPSRGVRQGCPLSPLLYVLTMEVLAANLRAHSDIVGICLPNSPSPLPVVSLYADDTSAIVISDSGIKAVFDVYSLFEKASGSRLNLGKCKGLWLGSWRGRSDSPVAIEWVSTMIKILGIYIGFGDVASANWNPRIDAVSKCLCSWRMRHLSLGGRALVSNALALSRIWYVASLVHMPRWVLSELNSLLFKFFWAGKRDLVRRDVLVQSRESGGFSVVSIALKVDALMVQWVRRFQVSNGAWISLLTYWLFDRFGVDPLDVLESPVNFPLSRLPPFYQGVLQAWRALGGSRDQSSGALSYIGDLNVRSPVSAVTCKLAYLRLLYLNEVIPHCVEKFRPVFGDLYWNTTWSQLFYMPLDRTISDLSWKIAHGVLYTAERLSSFGYNIPTSCFCGAPVESLDHLFFYCPLAQSGIDWIQSLLFLAAPTASSICLRHLLFGFSPDELVVVPKVFVYLLLVLKSCIWSQRNDFRFRSIRPSAIGLLASVRARVRFYLPLFFKRFISPRKRRYFHRQWGGNGVICVVRDSSLTLSI